MRGKAGAVLSGFGERKKKARIHPRQVSSGPELPGNNGYYCYYYCGKSSSMSLSTVRSILSSVSYVPASISCRTRWIRSVRTSDAWSIFAAMIDAVEISTTSATHPGPDWPCAARGGCAGSMALGADTGWIPLMLVIIHLFGAGPPRSAFGRLFRHGVATWCIRVHHGGLDAAPVHPYPFSFPCGGLPIGGLTRQARHPDGPKHPCLAVLLSRDRVCFLE